MLYPQTGSRTLAAAYPYGLIWLDDVMLGESAARSGTIAGTDARAPVVRARLGRVTRVWVVQSNVSSPGRPAELRGLPFRLVRTVAGDRLLAVPVRLPGLISAWGPLSLGPAQPGARSGRGCGASGEDSASRACSRSLTSSGV